MTDDPIAPKTRPRSSRLKILLPTLLVAVIAIGWSVFWVVASHQAETRLDAYLASEAAKGREVHCAERTLGGFPFRLELRCREPRIEVTREDGRYSVAAQNFVAVAQVYDPMKVIAEATGPLTLTPIGERGPVEASWRKAEASFAFTPSGPQRLSIVAEGLSAKAMIEGAARDLLANARLEAHLRAAAEPGSYDLVARLDAADVPPLDAVLGGTDPAKIEIQGTVTGVNDLTPKSLEERLRDWSAAGGVFKLALFKIDRGTTSATANGQVALDQEGYPTGQIAVALAGVDGLAKGLKRAGVAPAGLTRLLGFGLAVLGKPTNIDGKPAVEVPLTLADGRASLGAFPAGPTPRFF